MRELFPQGDATHRERQGNLRAVVNETEQVRSEPRAVEAERELSATGLFKELQEQLRKKENSSGAVLGITQFILTRAPLQLAKAFNFIEGDEEALVGEEDSLEIDTQGRLLFHSGTATRILMRQTAEGPEITQFYTGERRQSNPQQLAA